ncbi:MAG: hypothetical protein JWN46_2012 [Acidimicrobiales bacterium]|nr:hypothetical protein [Acidimicrobiales bacterium]
MARPCRFGKVAPMFTDPRDAERPTRPKAAGGAWTSFVAEDATPGTVFRSLHEQVNPRHRLRVEHDPHTLLIHLSDEDGPGWTTVAVDRPTRQWAVAQERRQSDAARVAFERL